MGTYKALKERALKDPKVCAEYERLNREEFALLDKMLEARRFKELRVSTDDRELKELNQIETSPREAKVVSIKD